MINLNKLINLSSNEFKETVKNLADHIAQGLDLRVEQSCLEILNQPTEIPSLEVLEGLRKVMLFAEEKGYSKTLENEIRVIANLCHAIKAAHPVHTPDLPPDMVNKVFSHTSLKELENIKTVSREWETKAPFLQIKMINDQGLKFKELFPNYTAAKVMQWLIKNPHHIHLEYANFDEFKDFDNKCLEELTLNCPNLKHLSFERNALEGDALKALEHVKDLQSLAMPYTSDFEDERTPKFLDADFLKNLMYVKNLRSLNIHGSSSLEDDALKYLEYVPDLENLDISECNRVNADSLKYLKHLPKLHSLNISGSIILRGDDGDALKYLEFVQNLKHLDISNLDSDEFYTFNRDSLKYLIFVRNLLSLNISRFNELDPDSLKNLTYVENLQSLNISGCSRLERDSFDIAALKHLQNLNISYCPQFKDLGGLEHIKNLKNDQFDEEDYG